MTASQEELNNFIEYSYKMYKMMNSEDDIVNIFTMQSAYSVSFKDSFIALYDSDEENQSEISGLITTFINMTEQYEDRIFELGLSLTNEMLEVLHDGNLQNIC